MKQDFRVNGTHLETEAEGTVSVDGNKTRVAAFFAETARQWRQMTEWLASVVYSFRFFRGFTFLFVLRNAAERE